MLLDDKNQGRINYVPVKIELFNIKQKASYLGVVDSPQGGLGEGRSQVVGPGEGRSLLEVQDTPGKGAGTDPPRVEDMLVVTSQYTIQSEN